MSRGIYWRAPEVEQIIKDLVEIKCLFPDLQGVPILALFTEKKMTSSGKTVLAKIKKSSEFELALIETMLWKDDAPEPSPAYIMIVNYNAWLDLGKILIERVGEVDQCEALVFHELCHTEVKINDQGIASYKTKNHDFNGFFVEVAKYGAWLPDYQMTEKAFQGEIPNDDTAEE